MKTANSVLMQEARESLKGKWGLAIGTVVVYGLVVFITRSIPKVGPLISLLISGPLSLGVVIFSLAFSRGQNPKLEQIFEGLKRFGVSLGLYLLIMVFTILWTLLFIVPGLIASLSYSMAFFIIADDKSVGIGDAIKRSKTMMDGNKWKLLKLDLRFLGWAILCIFTLGIGFLWLVPYMWVTTAKFYEDIKTPNPTLAPVAA